LARIDVSSNEFFIPGLTTNWLPDIFYFGLGVVENPIDYEKTEMAKTVQLGGISDPLDLIEWWMDQADDSIDVSLLWQSLIEDNNDATTTVTEKEEEDDESDNDEDDDDATDDDHEEDEDYEDDNGQGEGREDLLSSL
jgi:hypothetical protein